MNQEELSRRVSTIVERGIAQGQIAGACVGVYQNQEELLCEAYGLADRESGRAIQTDALFRPPAFRIRGLAASPCSR